MFDEKMFEKICTVTCTFEELKDFAGGMDKKEFDLDNAFEKYYSLNIILYAIQQYKDKKITDRFLAHWACAYNWIIIAGFDFEIETNHKKREIIAFEISDWLDSLSFFDETEELFDIEKYINVFSSLDKIYRDLSDWEVEYAPTNDFCDENGDVWLLFVNRKTGEFLKILHEGYGDYLVEGQESWTEDDIDKAIQSLKENGYQELPYTNYDIDE